MIANIRRLVIANISRLVIAHLALGLASVFVYWARPGGLSQPLHMSGLKIAVAVVLMVFVAWIPYFLSGVYSCNVLAARDPKATLVFICFAVGVGITAACLNLNLIGMTQSPSPLLVSAGVAIVLLAAARLCSAIWRSEVSEWDSDP